VRDSDAELALREAEGDEPHNATITLACGRTVRLWLHDAERKRLGFKIEELRTSWCATKVDDDDAPRPKPASTRSRTSVTPSPEDLRVEALESGATFNRVRAAVP
jgi:hypothetical protein